MWQFEEEKLGSVGLSVAQLLLGIKMVLFFPLRGCSGRWVCKQTLKVKQYIPFLAFLQLQTSLSASSPPPKCAEQAKLNKILIAEQKSALNYLCNSYTPP